MRNPTFYYGDFSTFVSKTCQSRVSTESHSFPRSTFWAKDASRPWLDGISIVLFFLYTCILNSTILAKHTAPFLWFWSMMEFRRILPRSGYVRIFKPRVIFTDDRPHAQEFEFPAPATPATPTIPSKKSAYKQRQRPKQIACRSLFLVQFTIYTQRAPQRSHARPHWWEPCAGHISDVTVMSWTPRVCGMFFSIFHGSLPGISAVVCSL